jgi:hypothetical protein
VFQREVDAVLNGRKDPATGLESTHERALLIRSSAASAPG